MDTGAANQIRAIVGIPAPSESDVSAVGITKVRGRPTRCALSGATHQDGFGRPDHAVERRDGEGRFALLSDEGAGAELQANQITLNRIIKA